MRVVKQISAHIQCPALVVAIFDWDPYILPKTGKNKNRINS